MLLIWVMMTKMMVMNADADHEMHCLHIFESIPNICP